MFLRGDDKLSGLIVLSASLRVTSGSFSIHGGETSYH